MMKPRIGDWGWGIGDGGLGIGDWAQSPIPNPQSPIPNPHFIISVYKNILLKKFIIDVVFLPYSLITIQLMYLISYYKI